MIPYMAPEVLSYKDYSKGQLPPFSNKSDIYSLGVLLWELSSGHPPFKDEEYDDKLLALYIAGGKREQEKPDTPPDYYELYTDCWKGKPEERPTIEDVYDKLKSMLPKNIEISTTEDKKDDDLDEGR